MNGRIYNKVTKTILQNDLFTLNIFTINEFSLMMQD